MNISGNLNYQRTVVPLSRVGYNISLYISLLMRTISLDIKHIYTSKVLNNIKSYLYAGFKKYRKMCCTHFDTIIFTGDEIRKKKMKLIRFNYL